MCDIFTSLIVALKIGIGQVASLMIYFMGIQQSLLETLINRHTFLEETWCTALSRLHKINILRWFKQNFIKKNFSTLLQF